MKILEQTAKFLAEKLTAVSRKITVHTENHGNPHGVTKAQVGLGNADNTSDADKPLSAAQMEALGTMNGTISGHVAEASIHKTSPEIRAEITEADIPATLARIGDVDSRIVTHNKNPEAHADIREKIGEQIAEHTGKTDNPHRVTAAQVGLGNADNTSDADKPVSSATAAEIAAVRTETASRLNTKVDKQEGYGLSSNDYSTAEKKKLGHLGEYVRKCTFKRNTSSTHHYLRCETWDPAVGGENEILCEVPQVNETADGFCTPGMKTIIDGLSYGSGTLNAQGTPSALWNIGTPGGPSLKASGGQMEVRNAADTAYADLSVRDLSVKGNLAVEGESFIVNTQTVEVADNTILLNRGEVGAGVTKGIAGLEIDRGSEEKYKIIFDESDDRVKVGKGNDLWPVMLRDKDADLTAGNILIWDAAAKRAVSGKNIDTELSAYALKTDLDPLQTKTGDTRDNTVTFTEAAATENIGSGEKHTVIFGKIRKWFSSLGTLAFRNTVSIPEVDNLQNTLDGKETVFAKNTAFNKNFGSTAGSVCEGNDPRLSDARPAIGGTSDRAASAGRPGLELCPTNASMVSPVETGIRLILPFMANSNLMLCFTVRSYKSYQAHDIQFSGYLFPDSNQWYAPQAVMIAGTELIVIRMGRMDDGRAYVWIGSQSNYFGIAILDIVGGYGAVDLSSGWEIGTTDETPNVSFEKTLYPNATMDQMPVNAAKLTYLSDVWGLPSDVNGASGGWIRTPGNGLLPFGMNTADGSGSVGSTDWPFRTMHAKTFHGNLDGTATNAGNADMVDGLHADGFIQKTGDQNIEGNLTLSTQAASFISLNRNGVNKGYIGLGASASTDVYISNNVGGSSIKVGDNGKNYSNGKEIATTADLPRVFVSETEPNTTIGESFKDGDIWVQP